MFWNHCKLLVWTRSICNFLCQFCCCFRGYAMSYSLAAVESVGVSSSQSIFFNS